MSNLDVSALESSLAVLNVMLDWAIAFVVAGLVLEYSPKFWSRLTRVLSDRFIEKAGEVLVILGVAGELGMHIWSAQIEDKIKSVQRDKIIALETKLAPRELTDQQVEDIAAATKQFASQAYTLSVAVGSEPTALVCRIDKALSKAGWVRHESADLIKTRPYCSNATWEVGLNLITAVHIRVRLGSEFKLLDAASALGNALKSAGIEAYPELDANNNNVKDAATVAVLIGARL